MDSRDLRNLAEAWQSITTPETETEQLDEQGGRISPAARRAALQQRTADAAAIKAAEMKAGGGQTAVQQKLQQRYGGRTPSSRQLARHSSGASAARSVAATGRENLFRGGGGDAAMAKGLTRQQVMAQGVKNFQAKQASAPVATTPVRPSAPVTPVKPVASDTKPATPAGSAVADAKPATPVKRPSILSGLDDLKKMRQASQIRQQSGAPNVTSDMIGDKSVKAPTTPVARPGAAATPVARPVKKPLTPTQIRQGISASFDVFDVVKGHLMSEGYADTEEAALAIMANMSEEWRQSIIEEVPQRIKLVPPNRRLMKDAGPARVYNPNEPKKVKRV